MAVQCFSNEYFDFLLQSCQPCSLRCRTKPPPPCQSFCTTSADSPEKGTTWVIWFLVAFVLVLIPTVFLVTIILGKQLHGATGGLHPRHAGIQGKPRPLTTLCTPLDPKVDKHFNCFGEVNGKDKVETEHKIKDAVLESASFNDVKRSLWQNEEVEVHVCDMALSDYLFPLPAIEEGAAILVTTKTSACCNPGPGVRGDAFVEI
ncbi:tumor necrosis factor receptor superfamily member 17 [Pelodytes ibericus]